MYFRFHGKTLNSNQNIQRVEITIMKEHFNTLKNSYLTFDRTFYNNLAKAVDQNVL